MPTEDVSRWLKTTAVLLAMMNAGMNLGIFSPTFPDIAYITSSSTAQVSTSLTWIGVASIIGALGIGPMFDRFNGLLVLSICLVMQGVAIGLAPWFRILVVYQLMVAIASVFQTGIMTGGYTAGCIIWKKRPEMIFPIIQLTDLVHSLGTAITPQMIGPFLGKIPPHDTNRTDSNFNHTSATSNSTSGLFDGVQPIQAAYLIMAITDLCTAAACFCSFALDRGQTKVKTYEYNKNRMVRSRSYSMNDDGRRMITEEFQPETKERERSGSLMKDVLQKNFEDDGGSHQGHAKSDMQKMLLKRQQLQRRKEEMKKMEAMVKNDENRDAHGQPIQESLPAVSCSGKLLPLLIIVFLFFVVNGGRDALFMGLLYTFLNTYLHWTPYAGTLMVTMYHVTRVVIHVIFVFLAKCVSPAKLTVLNMFVLLAAGGVMLVTVNASPAYVGATIILTAFATSNLYPTAITLAQTCFQVDGKVMGAIMAAIFGGTCIAGPVVGMFLDSKGVITFPVILLVINVASACLTVVWLLAARLVKSRLQSEKAANEKTPLLKELP